MYSTKLIELMMKVRFSMLSGLNSSAIALLYSDKYALLWLGQASAIEMEMDMQM